MLINSAEVAKLGGPTFVAWITRKDYAAARPEVVKAVYQGHSRHLRAFPQGPGRLQGRNG